MVFGKDKRKSLNLHCYVSEGISEITITIKDLKDERISSFSLPTWLQQKLQGSW